MEFRRLLFRSTGSRAPAPRCGLVAPPSGARLVLPGTGFQDCRTLLERLVREPDGRRRLRGQGPADDPPYAAIEPADILAHVRIPAVDRSEGRRVGKRCVCSCSFWWASDS